MPYTKNTWVDHVVDLDTGEVLQEGTAVNADHLNHMEDGISTAQATAENGVSAAEAAQLAANAAQAAADAAAAAAEYAKRAAASAASVGNGAQETADNAASAASAAQTTADLAVRNAATAQGTANAAGSAAEAAQTTANEKAPKNHASNGYEHGIGANGLFGHLCLSDSLEYPQAGETFGTAATPKAINQVYELTKGKAPKNHATTETTYGLGSYVHYGHVRLADDLNAAHATQDYGYAATPHAVNQVYELAKAALPKAGGTLSGSLYIATAAYPAIFFNDSLGRTRGDIYSYSGADGIFGNMVLSVFREDGTDSAFMFTPDGVFNAPNYLQEKGVFIENKYLQQARVLCYKSASVAIAAGGVGTISVPNSMGLAPTVVVATPTSNKPGVACSVASTPAADKFNVYIANNSTAQVTIAANVLAIYKP